MNIRDYMKNEGEQPLDRIVDDGGFAAIFRTFACVGDSLSSGEFQTSDGKGGWGYHDLFEYSWGQYMARAMGSRCYNFSKGGMTAKAYLDRFAQEKGYWDPALACQAYIFALGVNDISTILRGEGTFGSMDDVKADWHENSRTFAGDYAAIIQRYKEISPDAKFFLMTMPVSPDRPVERVVLENEHAKLIHAMAAHFENAYVLDFRRYAPVYDETFRWNFYLNGHMNPMGYIMTAKMTMSYMDFIIRSNPDDFREVGLIGTPFVNVKA